MCEVARFYGWTHTEMLSMSVQTFSMYYRGYEVLSAREALLQLKISCAPDMKREARDRMWNRLSRESEMARPEAIPMTPENLERLMNG